MDFARKLPFTDTLNGLVDVAIARLTPGLDLTPLVEVGIAVATPVVLVQLDDGDDDADYNVEVAAQTTKGDVLHFDTTVAVRERVN